MFCFHCFFFPIYVVFFSSAKHRIFLWLSFYFRHLLGSNFSYAATAAKINERKTKCPQIRWVPFRCCIGFFFVCANLPNYILIDRTIQNAMHVGGFAGSEVPPFHHWAMCIQNYYIFMSSFASTWIQYNIINKLINARKFP